MTNPYDLDPTTNQPLFASEAEVNNLLYTIYYRYNDLMSQGKTQRAEDIKRQYHTTRQLFLNLGYDLSLPII